MGLGQEKCVKGSVLLFLAVWVPEQHFRVPCGFWLTVGSEATPGLFLEIAHDPPCFISSTLPLHSSFCRAADLRTFCLLLETGVGPPLSVFVLPALPGELGSFSSWLPQAEHPTLVSAPFWANSRCYGQAFPLCPSLQKMSSLGDGDWWAVVEHSSQWIFEGCLSLGGRNGRWETIQERSGERFGISSLQYE